MIRRVLKEGGEKGGLESAQSRVSHMRLLLHEKRLESNTLTRFRYVPIFRPVYYSFLTNAF